MVVNVTISNIIKPHHACMACKIVRADYGTCAFRREKVFTLTFLQFLRKKCTFADFKGLFMYFKKIVWVVSKNSTVFKIFKVEGLTFRISRNITTFQRAVARSLMGLKLINTWISLFFVLATLLFWDKLNSFE